MYEARALDIHLGSQAAAADARSVADSYRLQVFNDLAEVEAIWRADSERAASYVFQSFDWLRIWQETLGSQRGIVPYPVRIADANDRTVMLLPLGIRRIHLWRVLVFLGGGVSDYNAPVIATHGPARLGSAVMERIWPEILRRLPPVDIVWLSQMPVRIAGVPNPLIALPGTCEAGFAYAADGLPDSFKAFRETHRSQIFGSTDRKRRQAARVAPVAFDVLEGAEEIAETVRLAVAQKRRRYGRRSLPESCAAFYQEMARSSLQGGRPFVARLRIGDDTPATHVGAVHRGRFYFLLAGLDAGDWAKFSPGNQLTCEMLRWCIEQRLENFDMTTGAERYKQFFTDTRLPLFECRYCLTAKARPLLASLVLARWLSRRWREREPAGRNERRR